ncbi:MAG TPA: Fic family protein [Candidatus Paceibacterota bacterium]
MTNFEKPPVWQDKLDGRLFQRALDSGELSVLIDKAQKEYVYWDKFKYYPFPKGFSATEAWAYLKFSKRMSAREDTPVRSVQGETFTYSLTKTLYQRLNYIDTHGAGLMRSFSENPSDAQASKFIVSSLTEEAIASSQIEGANTTHKVAKEMILSARKPRTKDEQMIVNNYRAMQEIEEWKDLQLTERMLLDLQKILVDKTLDDAGGAGRFRTDDDEIVVSDPLTGDVVHYPPAEKVMRAELKRLIAYANKDETDDEFIHPVIKATILHFWLAYLHPYVDGNGRSARALFHWYLLKRDYWLVRYISVSKSIKVRRHAYDNAYRYSENDDADLTYFLVFIADAFRNAIDTFLIYFEKKQDEFARLKQTALRIGHYNERQISLLTYFLRHGAGVSTDVATHQNKHGVSRATANNDLRALAEAGLLTEIRQGKKMVYVPSIVNVRALLRNVK